MTATGVRRAADRGFTMIEMIVTIVLISILVGVSVPIMTTQRIRSYDAAVQGDLRALAAGADQYFGALFAYPQTNSELSQSGSTPNIDPQTEYRAFTIRSGADAGYVIYAKHAASPNVFAISSYTTKKVPTRTALTSLPTSPPVEGEQGVGPGIDVADWTVIDRNSAGAPTGAPTGAPVNVPTVSLNATPSVGAVTITWTATNVDAAGVLEFSSSTTSGATGFTEVVTKAAATSGTVDIPAGMGKQVWVKATYTKGATSATSNVTNATTANWSVYVELTGAGDWDGDGRNDIMGITTSGDAYLHPGTGAGTFNAPTKVGNIGTGVTKLSAFDANTIGGAQPSLTWLVGTYRYVAYSTGTGIGAKTAFATTGWTVVDSSPVAPGLWTGNAATIAGKRNDQGAGADFVVYTGSAGPNVAVAGWMGGGWQTAFPGDSLAGAADWDGDNKGDIVAIRSNGQACLYSSNGAGLWSRGAGCSQVLSSTNWTGAFRVSGGWDFTTDGKPDLLVRINDGTLRLVTNTGISGQTLGPALS